MPPDPGTDPAAFLAEAKRNWEVFGEGSETPVLIAALEAVLALHRRSTFPASGGENQGKHFCTACTVVGDPWTPTMYAVWPCGEYRDISAALLGEGNG